MLLRVEEQSLIRHTTIDGWRNGRKWGRLLGEMFGRLIGHRSEEKNPPIFPFPFKLSLFLEFPVAADAIGLTSAGLSSLRNTSLAELVKKGADDDDDDARGRTTNITDLRRRRPAVAVANFQRIINDGHLEMSK